MRDGVSGTVANGGRGIWRASIPAMAVAVCVRSFRRQSRPRLTQLRGRQFEAPAPFASLLLSLVIFVQTCALPLPLGLLFVDAAAHAVTTGCKTKSCCTALCYVDKNGVHHCVHMHGDSCDCGLSANDLDTDGTLHSIIAVLPKIQQLFPMFVPEGWISGAPVLTAACDPPPPTPPPK